MSEITDVEYEDGSHYSGLDASVGKAEEDLSKIKDHKPSISDAINATANQAHYDMTIDATNKPDFAQLLSRTMSTLQEWKRTWMQLFDSKAVDVSPQIVEIMLSNLGTRIQSAWNDLEEIVINGERRGQINTGTLLTELGVFCEELKLASAQPVASDPASAKAVEVAITSVKQWVNQFISLNNKYLSSAYCNQCNGFCDHHSAFRYGMKKAEERAKRVISAEPMIKMEDLQHGLNAVRQQVGDETFSKVHAILQATIPDYGLMLSEIVMCDENGNMVTSPVLHRSGLMDRASVYPTPNAAKELGF